MIKEHGFTSMGGHSDLGAFISLLMGTILKKNIFKESKSLDFLLRTVFLWL